MIIMGFKVTIGKDVVTYSKFLAFSFTSEKSQTSCSRYCVLKKKPNQQTNNWKRSSRPGTYILQLVITTFMGARKK